MPAKNKTKLSELLALSDAQILEAAASDPDAQPTDADFWADATVTLPKNKQQITLKLDPEIIDFFKQGGRGCNTRINAVLKSYVQAQAK